MEGIEEPSIPSAVNVPVKVNVVSVGTTSVEGDLCHKSNGVAESADTVYSISNDVVKEAVFPQTDSVTAGPETQHAVDNNSIVHETVASLAATEASAIVPEAEILAAMETTAAVENLLGIGNNVSDKNSEVIIETSEEVMFHGNDIPLQESTVENDNVSASNDKVTFQTEILIEKNDNDGCYDENIVPDGHDSSHNILSELGQGIDFSEALRSSDTTENVENNNCTERQEVFNKEELLDILEGNDEASPACKITQMLVCNDPNAKKLIEAQIALKQLSRLKNKRTKRNPRSKIIEQSPRKKRGKIAETISDIENTKIVKEETTEENSNITKKNTGLEEEHSNTAEKKKNDCIVNVLVKDWDDDEHLDDIGDSKKILEDSKDLIKKCNEIVESQETAPSQEVLTSRASTDSPIVEDQTGSCNKSGDEGHPQRRLGRVIKKKVIFDPDNPDTFTKGKIITKNKEVQSEKEQSPSKKPKTDQASSQRPKSKSPISKMQWKKPQPKNNSKQNKRLTEVDKLLMDEGAVNMIYQLTPEALKGKKNVKTTKAEFIKKIQSSTPDSKEMKFRERKKEARSEDGEPKKVLGGKQRSSLSSLKSPSVCDDFETHSADDSIIYRRHSSSSYSSACMSPRRLSDVDPGAVQSAARASRHASDSLNETLETSGDQVTDVFMPEDSNSTTNEIINKDDCLSIKEKLNSKLSLALKKRKRDNAKAEKQSKQKKSKVEGKNEKIKHEKIDGSFKYLTISFDQRLADICIEKTDSKYSIEIMKEIEQALEFIENRNDISVTSLTSQCGTLCSDLDYRPLLNDNIQIRTNNAYELAESVRSLLCTVDRHRKLLVSGVRGVCSGVALALVALSDVALASESATFGLDTLPPAPGVAALKARCRQLPQSLLNDLVVFGRRLSAGEALQHGLVSRTLWPARCADQTRAVARDIAAEPMQSILLKKKLLSLKSAESEAMFLSSLEKERDLLVEYWTSVEGQEMIRAKLNPV